MFAHFDNLVKQFEGGRMTRRDLVARLGAAAAAAIGVETMAQSQPPATPTMQAKGLNHIALRVTDVARSRDWYKKHLGLTVLRDGTANCFMRSRAHFVALFRSKTARMDHYCYSIDNYSAARAIETLEAAGLSPERHENRVYFRDPDGLKVQVAAPNDWSDWD